MRVRIVFHVKNKGANVPFHHQSILSQLIYEILNHTDNEFKDYNSYCFSGLKGQTKVSRDGLHFYSSKVTLVLAAFDEAFVKHFLNQLFKLEELQIGTLVLVPEWVEREVLPPFAETVKYLCISPLVIANPEELFFQAKKFVSPTSDDFSDLLYEATMSRMEASKKYTDDQIASFFRFQVVPDRAYLKRIQDSDKKFARIYSFHNKEQEKLEVRGYTFPFVLYAAPEVQEFIFNSGLGYFPNKGFGLLDLTNNLVSETEKYDFS